VLEGKYGDISLLSIIVDTTMRYNVFLEKYEYSAGIFDVNIET